MFAFSKPSCKTDDARCGRKIFVPANVPIVAYVPGDKSDLKAATKQPDGTLQGRAWRVGRDGVTPPM